LKSIIDKYANEQANNWET